MKSYIKHLVLISLIALSVPGYGEVFSLWPNAGKGNAGNAETALNPKNVWNEPVTINDVRLELNVGLIDMNAGDLVALLLKLFPNAKFATNSFSIERGGSQFCNRSHTMTTPAQNPPNGLSVTSRFDLG